MAPFVKGSLKNNFPTRLAIDHVPCSVNLRANFAAVRTVSNIYSFCLRLMLYELEQIAKLLVCGDEVPLVLCQCARQRSVQMPHDVIHPADRLCHVIEFSNQWGYLFNGERLSLGVPVLQHLEKF